MFTCTYACTLFTRAYACTIHTPQAYNGIRDIQHTPAPCSIRGREGRASISQKLSQRGGTTSLVLEQAKDVKELTFSQNPARTNGIASDSSFDRFQGDHLNAQNTTNVDDCYYTSSDLLNSRCFNSVRERKKIYFKFTNESIVME